MDVFVVSLADGSERRLGTGGFPRFSPDGRLISFVSHWDSPAGSALFVVGTGGGKPRSIRPDFYFFRGLAAWFSDGEHLLFVGRRSQSEKLKFWITPIDGGPAVDTGFGPIHESPIKTLGLTGGLRWITGTNRAVVADNFAGDLWHLGFAAKTFQFDGDLRRIPRPYPAGAQNPNLTGDRLVFASCTTNVDVRALGVDAGRGVVRGPLERLTDNPDQSRLTSASWSGTSFAYIRTIGGGSRRPWIRDLERDQDAAINNQMTLFGVPRMSPDGSLVALSGLEVENGPLEIYSTQALSKETSIYIAPFEGGPTRKLCRDCGFPGGWTPDSRAVLIVQMDIAAQHYEISLIPADGGPRSPLLECEGCRLDNPSVSRDGRWLLFTTVNSGSENLMTAAFRSDSRTSMNERNPLIAGADGGVLSPKFSPDGRLVYYVSRRDGWSCVWAQPVSPDTGGPAGDPFGVYHSHRFSSSIDLGKTAGIPWIAVTDDRLILSYGETTGNVWMYEGVELD